MRELHRVREDPSYVKDISSGAVLRTDLEAFQARKAKKAEAQKLRDNERRISELEERVAELERLIKEGLQNGR
uniref:Virion structural protein n=1 Tax=Ochrobactrum phage ORM_20 TaxID=2985243 RepID=A0A9N6ZEZ8_9VIRU|nr:virion structural protein [Ochrobactrum phage ORM_20]